VPMQRRRVGKIARRIVATLFAIGARDYLSLSGRPRESGDP